MTHPLSASGVKAATHDTGATADAKDPLKRGKSGRTVTDAFILRAFRVVPLSHETSSRAGPAAFTLLNEVAEFGNLWG